MIDIKRHEQIKAALSLNGTSLSAVARALAVSPTTVTIVSMGYRRSKRVEAAIAAAIKCAPDSVWPDRYASNAQPRGRRMSP